MPKYAFDDTASSGVASRVLIAASDAAATGASLAVHPDDDMYAFSVAVTGAVPIGAMAYFRAGLSINDTMMKIVRWRFGERTDLQILDFAAGYGRSTRFLVHHFSPDQICVSEIQTDALIFQAQEFGVRTLQSVTDPGALETSDRFNVIFVASLFTHLPESSFGPWLQRLWNLLTADGVLVFSVHDEAINDLDAKLDDKGFAFIASSEVAALSTEEYGTNFTTEAFVRAKIAEFIGDTAAATATRFPRGLAFMQDIWVITNGPLLGEPLIYECGPSGAVDHLARSRRESRLRGWAADRGFSVVGERHSHQIVAVRILLNGICIGDAAVGEVRPDVAEHLGHPSDPLLRDSGWTAILRQRDMKLDDVLTAVATCDHGASFVLDSTTIDDLLARSGSLAPSKRLVQRATTARNLWAQGGPRLVLGHSLVVLGRFLQRAGDRIGPG
jgi:SAM-dependent methyltransferase